MFTVTQRIENLRKELLINRLLYYVHCQSRISDSDYDKMDKELRRLCDKYPSESMDAAYYAICPSLTVGSDMEDTYPPELVKEAKSRL